MGWGGGGGGGVLEEGDIAAHDNSVLKEQGCGSGCIWSDLDSDPDFNEKIKIRSKYSKSFLIFIFLSQSY